MFGALGIALKYQRKVLFWGILGAIVMRGVFIFAGVSVLERFEWVMYLFGALLLYTAFRMLRSHGVKVDPQRNPLVRFAQRFFPFDADYVGGAFTVRRGGRRLLTPLAIALVAAAVAHNASVVRGRRPRWTVGKRSGMCSMSASATSTAHRKSAPRPEARDSNQSGVLTMSASVAERTTRHKVSRPGPVVERRSADCG